MATHDLSRFSTSEIQAELARRKVEDETLASFYISNHSMGGFGDGKEVIEYDEKERILTFWLGSVARGRVVCLEKADGVKILNGDVWYECKLYNTIHPGLIHCRYKLAENEIVPTEIKGIDAKFGVRTFFIGPFKVIRV